MLKTITRVTSTIKQSIPKKSQTRGERYIVALDIGTENVKVLIGQIHDNDVDIIGIGRSHQGLSDMQAGAVADIAAVTANCNRALAQAEEMAGVSARAVVVGIAGELVKGTTTSVRVTRKNSEKPLDIEEVEKIVSLVQKRALDRAKNQIMAELGGKEVDVRLVNSALVRMEIDGYVVTNPVGFSGREVTVLLYTAFAPLIHIGAIEQVVNQLDMDLIAVAAEPFAVSRSVTGDESDSTMSAVLMDVGGGTTDIAILDQGGVQGTVMFGIGGRAFTRTIEKDLNKTFAQAESLKLSLTDDSIASKLKPSVEKALDKTVKVWRSGVELAIEEFKNLDHIPHNILLCGGGSSLEMLVDELEQSNWYKSLPFTKKPAVRYIKPENVVGIIDTTDKLNDHTFITAMGLLRVGIDTIDQSDIQDAAPTVKDRINRILRI